MGAEGGGREVASLPRHISALALIAAFVDAAAEEGFAAEVAGVGHGDAVAAGEIEDFSGSVGPRDRRCAASGDDRRIKSEGRRAGRCGFGRGLAPLTPSPSSPYQSRLKFCGDVPCGHSFS